MPRTPGPRATRGKRWNKKLTKKEIVQVHALKKLGHSNYAVEKRTGINHATVAKYLVDQPAYSDPHFQQLVDRVCEKEILDLVSLTVEARARLHQLAPTMNPIEATALMDRSFQQRRLLEGKSTNNIATLAKIISAANDDLEG